MGATQNPVGEFCNPPHPLQSVEQRGRYFFFGSPFFVAAPLDSLDPAAILKLYDFYIFPFDKSQRNARAPFLLLFPSSFPLPINLRVGAGDAAAAKFDRSLR